MGADDELGGAPGEGPGRAPGPAPHLASGADPGTDPDLDAAPRVDDLTPVAEALGLTPPGEVARAALNRAKAAAAARGLRPGSPASAHRRTAGPDLRSAAGRDGRDPVPLAETVARLAAERGWSTDLSVGGVIGRWREVVGDQVADHCTPESFVDGVLAVRTDSTAWATELTLLSPRLLERLAADLGAGVVTEVKVLGPAAPRWARGRRQVPGRGPRDTYG